MPQNKSVARQDPFRGSAGHVEPTDDLQEVVPSATMAPAALVQKRGARKRPRRPSEARRSRRQLPVTFSDAAIPDRIRALTERWGITGPDGVHPNYSKVVEYLILPRLEAAEKGKVPPLEGEDR